MKKAILSLLWASPTRWMNTLDVRDHLDSLGFWFVDARVYVALRALVDEGLIQRREVDDRRPERGGRPTVQYRVTFTNVARSAA